MAKVVVSRRLSDPAIDALKSCKEIDIVLWEPDRKADREWLLSNVVGAVGLVVTLTDKVDKCLIDAAGPSLKVVSTMSVGYDHVDIAILKARGIKLGFTPDVLTDAVADIAVMLALMASRMSSKQWRYFEYHDSQWTNTPWSPSLLTGPQLSTPGTTVGFIGFGRISRATLARLVPFRISRVVYTRSSSPPVPTNDLALLSEFPTLKEAKWVGLDELARECDFVFVLTPGGEATKHLVGKDFLSKMKKNAVLVNPGRGSVVDSNALAEALKEGHIWGAGLDVVDGEPNIPADHALVKEPRAVVLPHIGSATVQTRLDMAQLAVSNLIAGIRGERMPSEAAL
ncbi:D-isomer specific 2-hydroxyacid dehydrogenase, NAD binding domain [Rhizoctonia solani]|uniref:D-isomer specific 2-hydroxyacid dehydrogenase, NAD binding domain n=1 Tax=Rhizoctonia solani TaxID=456999 RepID=A0A8H8P4L5_9AGAM|nr:D-isomer specific 2-hydroxyacid dehydrogenase, NAD binding domain [Rhizoctonia solani]QRW23507.1 D-isomer specific 2-hydroxyacid dehydrogenase, NAD binding domain [Rhizoctonia solani]